MWSKLEKILNHLLDKHYNNVSLESMIKDVTDRIETIKYKLMQEDDSEEKVNRMSFLTEQFSLIFKEQKRYSPKMIITAFLIFMQSKKCYETLRSNNILILPHPKYIQRLTASLNISPENASENTTLFEINW
jgi:hypothetical protein